MDVNKTPFIFEGHNFSVGQVGPLMTVTSREEFPFCISVHLVNNTIDYQIGPLQDDDYNLDGPKFKRASAIAEAALKVINL